MDSARSIRPPGTARGEIDRHTGSSGWTSRLPRRTLLGGLGALAASALAGCSEITSYEFRVDAVVLPAAGRAALDYTESAREPIVVERSRTVGGATVDATIESQMASYESNWSLEATPSGEEPNVLRVGALSTPEANVLETSLNPLTEVALQDVLTHDDATEFFDRVGLTDGEETAWVRGPAPIGTGGTTLLGEQTVMESFGGIVETSGTQSVVFAHVARAAVEETAVITTGVHDRTVDSPDGPYVGRDGFVSTDGFERAIDAVNDSNAEFALVSE